LSSSLPYLLAFLIQKLDAGLYRIPLPASPQQLPFDSAIGAGIDAISVIFDNGDFFLTPVVSVGAMRLEQMFTYCRGHIGAITTL
jgi:hypothetical protein